MSLDSAAILLLHQFLQSLLSSPLHLCRLILNTASFSTTSFCLEKKLRFRKCMPRYLLWRNYWFYIRLDNNLIFTLMISICKLLYTHLGIGLNILWTMKKTFIFIQLLPLFHRPLTPVVQPDAIISVWTLIETYYYIFYSMPQHMLR